MAKRRIIRIVEYVIICLLVFLCPARFVSAAAARTTVPAFDTGLSHVRDYILSVDRDPGYASIWNAIGLVRGGQSTSSDYVKTFYRNTVNELEEAKWQLSRTKYSDYSKLIIAMTAIGVDARDIAGHNMLSYLSDFSKVKLQGFNGPIWALIALNCHPDYQIPTDSSVTEQTTEEGLISYLLARETSKGGWTLAGDTPDTDITGMTIQALAPYYGKREDVTAAVDRALAWLSSAQNPAGGYSTLNGNSTVETSESAAQVIVALCSLGIDPETDSRFIQADGSWVLSRLFDYYKAKTSSTGGFMHVLPGASNNGGGDGGSIDGMATEQGFYACVAYKRLLSGKTGLFDMSDLTLTPGKKPDSSPSTESTKKQENTTEASKTKVSSVTLNYSQISLAKGKTRKLTATVRPSGANNKKLTWSSSNTNIATVTQKGSVKGVSAGTAVITAKAKDGSGRKATCKVVVYTPASSSTSSTSSTYSNSSTNPASSYGRVGTYGRSYVQTGAGGTGATGTAGNGSGTSASGTSAEESTEATAWSFNGASYVPDSSSPQTDEEDSDQSEDMEEMESEELELEDAEMGGDLGIQDENAPGTVHLPMWLSVLIGLGLVLAPVAYMKRRG